MYTFYWRYLNFLTAQCRIGRGRSHAKNQPSPSSRFDTILACDGQTAIYYASIVSHGKNQSTVLSSERNCHWIHGLLVEVHCRSHLELCSDGNCERLFLWSRDSTCFVSVAMGMLKHYLSSLQILLDCLHSIRAALWSLHRSFAVNVFAWIPVYISRHEEPVAVRKLLQIVLHYCLQLTPCIFVPEMFSTSQWWHWWSVVHIA